MEAKLNIYEDCTTDQPTKTYICRRLTFDAASKIDILSEKVHKLENKKEKATAEEVKKINLEQLDYNIEILQTLFPNFVKDDFKGIDVVEYSDFINKIGGEKTEILNRASKN